MTDEEKKRLDGLTAKQLYMELWELQQQIGADKLLLESSDIDKRIKAFYIDLLFSEKMKYNGVDWD